MDTSALRSSLYPEIEPYNAGMLPLDGRHRMYFEESGNPKGAPVLFLHGGPGAGAAAAHPCLFQAAAHSRWLRQRKAPTL